MNSSPMPDSYRFITTFFLCLGSVIGHIPDWYGVTLFNEYCLYSERFHEKVNYKIRKAVR